MFFCLGFFFRLFWIVLDCFLDCFLSWFFFCCFFCCFFVFFCSLIPLLFFCVYFVVLFVILSFFWFTFFYFFPCVCFFCGFLFFLAHLQVRRLETGTYPLNPCNPVQDGDNPRPCICIGSNIRSSNHDAYQSRGKPARMDRGRLQTSETASSWPCRMHYYMSCG